MNEILKPLDSYETCQIKVNNFRELKEWLNSLSLTQMAGPSDAFCVQTGKMYDEIYHSSYSRIGDEIHHEEMIANLMVFDISRKIENAIRMTTGKIKDATIYWRFTPEFATQERRDLIKNTNEYVKNNDWIIIKAYCRLSVV